MVVGGAGTTALHLATSKEHTKIVELLIGAGADVNCKNREGTPLDIAVEKGYKDIAELLRKHGAVK